jgi:UDP-N-acetylglucosamine:LPS N-acetylglucosamine transferase
LVRCQASPSKRPCLAYFITSHGFGHAARAAAVMQTLLDRNPGIRLIIYTQTPEWFFRDSLHHPFHYESVQTDVGMIQQSPTREDINASIDALEKFRRNFDPQCQMLAKQMVKLNCKLVLCDISPLGLAVAQLAQIPSILIENFTWDWIYNHYPNKVKRALMPYSEFFDRQYASATFRIQTQPVCQKVAADFYSLPVSRKTKLPPAKIRSQLKIPPDNSMVLVTMGGTPSQYPFLKALEKLSGIYFIMPGAVKQFKRHHNLILLPEHSPYYHPDLIHASDAVIGKVGYSTLAEVYHAGVPFGYVKRPVFPESPKLTMFIEREMVGIDIEEADFYHGAWIDKVPELLKSGRIQRIADNGAVQIADFISRHFTFLD